MRIYPDLKLLAYARALATHESFTIAARELGISQPALSRGIRRLEETAGASLFTRSRRGITPTDAGDVLLAHAAPLLAEAQALEREIGRLKGLGRTVYRVGVGPFARSLIIGGAVGRLHRECPEVGIELRIDQPVELSRAVRRQELDVAVADGSLREFEDQLSYEAIEPVQGYFLVRGGHPLLSVPDLTLRDVLRYPFVLSGRIPPRILDPLLESLPRSDALSSDSPAPAFPAIDCPAPETIIEIVMKSDAVGVTALAIAERQLRAGTARILELEAPWLKTAFAIIRRRGERPSELGERFVQEIRSANDEAVRRSVQLQAELYGR